MIETRIKDQNSWVLSGSLCSWGDPLVPNFTHVIFLQTTWKIREQRLLARERSRYGMGIFSSDTPQGTICREFIEWAGRYDAAGLEQRSLKSHTAWLNTLPDHITLIELDGSEPLDRLVDRCLGSMR